MIIDINLENLDQVIDELMIERGEHPDRVRNPIYSEERELAKNTVFRLLRHSKLTMLVQSNDKIPPAQSGS